MQIGTIIIDVVLQCEHCKQFKKPAFRPTVGLPKPQNSIKYLLTFIILNQTHGTSI